MSRLLLRGTSLLMAGFEPAPEMQVQLPNVELHLLRVDALVQEVL